MGTPGTLLSLGFLTASLMGSCYLAIAIAGTRAFGRRKVAAAARMPRISVLKPIAGLEYALAENLASFCRQEYPDFEIFFCVHDEHDSAIPTIEAAMRAYPQCRAQLFVGHDGAQRNPKIANLSKAAACAGGEIVVVADSDIRVESTYLRTLAAAFDDPRVGAATCLYRALPVPGLVAQLGAAYIEEQFAPSVLVASTIGTLRFCMGATMAVRRDALAAIGGITALGAYLADDHALGELVSARGYDIALSRYVVETTVTETSPSHLWFHELRWARTNMTLAPIGYFFSFLMFPIPLALLFLIVSRNVALGCALVATALGLRFALGSAARAALGITRTTPLWLAPVRDLLSFALWFVSLFGRAVRWRDRDVSIAPDGKMH